MFDEENLHDVCQGCGRVLDGSAALQGYQWGGVLVRAGDDGAAAGAVGFCGSCSEFSELVLAATFLTLHLTSLYTSYQASVIRRRVDCRPPRCNRTPADALHTGMPYLAWKELL